ncbi:galactitol-1-phosphate 5-dehydrogenase [Staphylococcus equorum]|uniref:galactitol-1-phosphate 5-dehydrogenase n=1 Tax=Staphylococcus equorum TaxID=246432 RepID=UPI000D1CF934|nr:galactitol-1-phosphate 5-dehydrogenase [Staphylococcus equorum]MDK9848066.1 galactitol-1-phosphate 5-dehydrogenase [Staphylococcus equorum]PTE90977.1 galactitol-1-phosphate 5-dehydrogenase [Staphylococcus equorum]
MKSLSLVEKEKFELVDKEMPHVNDNQVLIKVAYCGVCGSDLDRYFKGKVHYFPITLGHEFSGVVYQIGNDVNNFHIGDRVTAAPLVPCRNCEYCERGEYSHCPQYSFVGSRQDGAMAEYVTVNVENVISVPDNVTLKEAALIEPLTVALHGVERINMNAGSEVLIFGAGSIGMMTLLSVKALGAGKITVIDLNEEKLAKAKALGADEIINPIKVDLDNYFENNVKPEIVFETAGASQTQLQSIKYVKHLGKVVFIGTATKEVNFEPKLFEQILRKEIIVTGSWMSYSAPFPGREWETGLNYISKGKIDVKPLISEVFKLEDKNLPFDRMIDKNLSSVKYLYEINP